MAHKKGWTEMVLVDVYIPSVDETFDFMLDETAGADQIMLEIYEMVAKKMNSSTEEGIDEFLLYHMTTGKLVERGRTLAESGVRDGSRLMLL